MPAPRSHRLVVVEDDTPLRDMIRNLLAREGWRVTGVRDAPGLDAAWADEVPDLVVLDINLPGEDGLSIARRLAATTDVSILMLTARSEDLDRVVGLEIGADDYLGKPFHPRELVARVRALLRRRDKIATTGDGVLGIAGLEIDPAARRVVRCGEGRDLALTGAEFDLLLVLAQAHGRILSRDHLLDRVHGRSAHATDRAIDVLVSRLRKKIDTGEGPSLIEGVRNAGYVLRAP